jgi:hypothetical protein
MLKYPQPDSERSQWFEDPNFKLVVLSDLINQNLIDLGSYEEFAKHVPGREVNFNNEGYGLLPECLDYLYHYPLSETLLRSVKRIVFDGGLEIYSYAYRYWDGETDEFDVKSIPGIDHCPNVTFFDDISLCHDTNLSKLSRLKGLEKVRLSNRAYDQYESLRSLPALKTISVFKRHVSPDGLKVLALLKAQGVDVTLN